MNYVLKVALKPKVLRVLPAPESACVRGVYVINARQHKAKVAAIMLPQCHCCTLSSPLVFPLTANEFSFRSSELPLLKVYY